MNKLSQLEKIKEKHLARRHDFKRQLSNPNTATTAVPVHNPQQKDFLTSLFTSSNSSGSHSNNNLYPSSTHYSQQIDHGQLHSLDEFLSPPSYPPMTNHPSASTSQHSYMNMSFDDPLTLINEQEDSPTYPY